MTCWRCGRSGEHTAWCSDGTPSDCDHCGGNPCRWWCDGPDAVVYSYNPKRRTHARALRGAA